MFVIGEKVLSPVSMLTYKGDLNLCLKFVSAEHISGKRRGANYKGELQVIVKEARNLSAVRSNGFSDPFCKGSAVKTKLSESILFCCLLLNWYCIFLTKIYVTLAFQDVCFISVFYPQVDPGIK